jgi:outer membrane protein assembly factor BamD (BamD/ComL family)
MTNMHRTLSWRAGLSLALGVLTLGDGVRAQQAAPPDEKAAALQKLVESVQRDPASATPETVAQMITLGKETRRPQAAAALTKGYLAQRRDVSPELILAAAEIAEWAGDVRTAAGRYKQYLRVAPAGADLSGPIQQLYRLLLSGEGNTDDAYRLMTELGDKGRATPALKRYDRWVLDEASRRKDVPARAARLASLMADAMPLELERQLAWDHLDGLMRDLAAAAPSQYPAVPDCRKIAPLIRENAAWSARFRFLTENLAFYAGSGGKDKATLERDFDAVASAARAYLEAAPTAATMREILRTFAGGWDRVDWTQLGTYSDKKAPLFADAFARMSDAERKAVFSDGDGWNAAQWAGSLTSRERFGQVMAANADFFRTLPVVSSIPLDTDCTNPAVYKAIGPALQGIPNSDALVVTALGSSDDLVACWQRVVQDSWFLPSATALRRALERVSSSYSRFPRPADQKMKPQDIERAFFRFESESLSKTPAFLFDVELASGYVSYAWRYAGADNLDKSKVGEYFHRLDWIPYSEKDRQAVFASARNEFRQWAEGVRNRQKAALAGKPEAERAKVDAAANSIVALEETFRQCAELKQTDPAKAPDELCRTLARAVSAQAAKDPAAFTEAARSIYATVKTYPAQRTPFGRMLFLFAVSNRLDAFDTLDFQCEALAGQLAAGSPESGNRMAGDLYAQIVDKRPWGQGATPDPDKEKMIKLNGVLAKGLRDLLAKNQFSATVFGWFIDTRRRQNWSITDRDLDIMEQMIAKKLGRGIDLQGWTRNEFPKLLEKYPADGGFDDLIIDDLRKTRHAGMLQQYYQQGGRDSKRKIVNALAEVFQSYERLPFGYDNGPVVYRPASSFWAYQEQAMTADPAVRDAMLAKLESYGGKTRFDTYANGGARLGTMAIGKPFFGALSTWIAAREKEPMQAAQPAMGQLSAVKPADLSDDELSILVRLLQLGPSWNPDYFGALDQMILEGFVARKRVADLFPLASPLWTLARQVPGLREATRIRMVESTTRLAEAGLSDLAATYASAGLDVAGSVLRDDQRSALTAVRSKALSGLGAALGVNKSDRRYPIFQAQSDYYAGKFQAAWETYLANRDLLSAAYRELDPGFSLWLIVRMIDVGNFTDAETLCRSMIEWMDLTPQGFDPEDRARLLLAYAQVFASRQDYPRARAIYEQVAAAAEFAATRARLDAELRIIEIDQINAQYEKAGERLDKLLRNSDPYVQAEGNYQYALLKFNQDEFADARSYLDKVFSITPSHPGARILEGKINVRTKKLEEATSVKVGDLAAREIIAPGRPLKVSLEDRNLSIVGRMTSIQLRAWTDSGDEETFSLKPFGDSKTKFEGQIPTALAPTQKGDGTLQVLGGDTVHYDYSDAFKKAASITSQQQPKAIRVVADAELYASSGRIRSRAEQEQEQMEQMLRERAKIEQAEKTPAVTLLSTKRQVSEIRPGNRINLRVVAQGQSRTAGKDKVPVKVSAVSGDVVSRVQLEETGAHSGIFEGSVPTALAPATAFASDSQEGKEPNFAITGEEKYGAWVAEPDNKRAKWFSVDLNNSAALGQLKIVADVPGRKLKQFVLQTSLNGKDFQSVCAWPRNYDAWTGDARLEVVRYAAAPANTPAQTAVPGIGGLRDYFEVGYLEKGFEKVAITPTSLNFNWDQNVNGLADRLKLGMDVSDSVYAGRLRLSFYQPKRGKRVFTIGRNVVVGELAERDTQFSLLLDGGSADPKKIRPLAKGFHTLEVIFTTTRKAGLQFWIEDENGPCKLAAFDVPAGVDPKERAATRTVAFVPAAITNAPGNGEFTVAFQPDTSARMLRLRLLDFETDAPAIRRLSLASAGGGKRILPTEQDVVKCKENDQLEVVPGDKITVTYENPEPVTPERRIQEIFMGATFYNASLSACFVESTLDARGNREPTYIPMRRFNPGDTVNVFIQDSDRDISPEPDSLKFTARVGATGKPVEIEAVETGSNTAVFVGRIFPVAGQPQRPSELQVAPGDDIILSYWDAENSDPGIPWERTYAVEQTFPSVPELRVYTYDVNRLVAADVQALASAASKAMKKAEKSSDETVPVRGKITITRPVGQDLPGSVLLGCPLLVEVLYPTIALSPSSRTEIFVQTAAGRKLKGGETPPGTFDVTVPGTIRVSASASGVGRPTPPAGYLQTVSLVDKSEGRGVGDDPLTLGQFGFGVPVKLGAAAAVSLIDKKVEKPVPGKTPSPEELEDDPTVARVCGDDELFIGYQYTDDKGSNRWLVTSARLISDPMMDVMDRRYQETVTNLNMGETLFYRVIDPGLDRSNDRDTVSLSVASAAGKRDLTLTETFAHSGVFKSLSPVLYGGDPAATNTPGAVKANYGDTIAIEYRTVSSTQVLATAVQVPKGMDGDVMPFTKRFADAATAVQTGFTMAESYFEMAKNHRKLGQEDMAQREIGQGKKLLEEVLRDYPLNDARAQAEYLLGNLAFEFAEQVKDDQQKMKYRIEAVGRFTEIVSSFPDSPYAPKSQFKKALTYEKMDRFDDACEEYVKLSYRYPDNELVAETIARLGQFFLMKGKGFQDQIAAEKDLVARERIRLQTIDMFKTAARVFSRLAVRFPEHKLAGKTTVVSGQCYMRAEDFDGAIGAFDSVVAVKKAEPEVIAEAMYWCGDSHVKRGKALGNDLAAANDMKDAYRMFKKVTWDYPDSLWAKYARGRLSEGAMAKLDAEEGK